MSVKTEAASLETGSMLLMSDSFVLNDFTINSDYCFKVIANLNGGSVSSSTKLA